MSIVVYGIPNCDTVKKARRWLETNSIDYEFHDYKKVGIDQKSLQRWCKEHGWETLLNKRGTTWRKLDEPDKTNLDEARAIALMQTNTSLIKRPVLEYNKTCLVGFNETTYAEVLERA